MAQRRDAGSIMTDPRISDALRLKRKKKKQNNNTAGCKERTLSESGLLKIGVLGSAGSKETKSVDHFYNFSPQLLSSISTKGSDGLNLSPDRLMALLLLLLSIPAAGC